MPDSASKHCKRDETASLTTDNYRVKGCIEDLLFMLLVFIHVVIPKSLRPALFFGPMDGVTFRPGTRIILLEVVEVCLCGVYVCLPRDLLPYPDLGFIGLVDDFEITLLAIGCASDAIRRSQIGRHE